MISVVLFGTLGASGRPATSEDAVRTLSALVPGAVEGVFRDVQLLGTAAAPELAKVAEHAGCAYAAGALPAVLPRAIAAARSPAVLLLLSGASFDRALTDEMAGTTLRHAGWLRDGIALKAEPQGTLERLLPCLAATVGALTTRERLASLQPTSVPALWKSLRVRRSFNNRAWAGE